MRKAIKKITPLNRHAGREQSPSSLDWVPPDLDASKLQHRWGDSVLLEFVRGHSPSDVLRELIQNEYDAGGNTLRVTFGDTALEVVGNGSPIDSKGWKRLAVTLGTGIVSDSETSIDEKMNGIGSKNFGLRSLFLFGDKIHIRSNGKQTLLDLNRGTPKHCWSDPSTIGIRGVQIYVPYRKEKNRLLKEFTITDEEHFLDNFSKHISLSLLKLAHHSSGKNLQSVSVSSTRNHREITWKQSVRKLSSERGTIVLVRRTTMKDSKSQQTVTKEEHEWQKQYTLPEDFRYERIPSYFRSRKSQIRIGISLQTKRGKLFSDSNPGIAYYPIGVAQAYTGNSVSISAPFEMDADRSELINSTNSSFNGWLAGVAADMTITLLCSDWFERFGSIVYQSVGKIGSSVIPEYIERIESSLTNNSCWPCRDVLKNKKTKFKCANTLNVAESSVLDSFLENEKYLHSALCKSSELLSLAKRYGVKTFTVNSLVHLRCDRGSQNIRSTTQENESRYRYIEFDMHWKDPSAQRRCSDAFDKHQKELSKENRCNLASSESTLAADGSLVAAEDLWLVPEKIANVCPVSVERRLHPQLSQGLVLKTLCKDFNINKWIEDVIERLESGCENEHERIALYRYLVSESGAISRRTRAIIRKSPVLLNRAGNWTEPKLITIPTAKVRSFYPALHLPHRDYEKNKKLANILRFKNKVDGDDVVRFANIVSTHPEIADKLEKALLRRPDLLTTRTVNRLKSIEFIRSNSGQLQSPENLYIATSRIKACMGPDGPYPASDAIRLFKKLGCRSKPTVERIMEYLACLRQRGESPPYPEILYPELAAAFEREPAHPGCENDKILWTGTDYSAPADTLLGTKWNNIFLGNVPTIQASKKSLKQGYLKLGLQKQPTQRHWKILFIAIGSKYQETSHVLTNDQRKAIHRAYKSCDDMPTLPVDIPWLLDDEGHLHAASDVDSDRFVINNDETLGLALRKMNPTVSFADDSDSRVTAFFLRIGVKYLTSVAKKTEDQIDGEDPGPPWFQECDYRQRLSADYFSSALREIAIRDFTGNAIVHDRVQGIIKRLNALTSIGFSKKICTKYRISQTNVIIPTKYAWMNNCIYLSLGHKNKRSNFESMLAQLISQECFPDSVENRNPFSDSVFRLVSCENFSGIREYMEQRGIRLYSNDESQDDNDYMGEMEEEVEEIVRDALRPRGISESKPVEIKPVREVCHETDIALDLPPIDEVEPKIAQPNCDWAYSHRGSEHSSGGGRGRSPVERNEKKDKEVGRRGEEIVFMLEKKRVRELGYSEDCVKWVSEENPTSDFDIESVDEDGERLYIEVKSTTGSDGKFHWSLPEFRRALREQGRYILYRVYEVSDHSPTVLQFRNPTSLMSRGRLHLDIESFRAEVQPSD